MEVCGKNDELCLSLGVGFEVSKLMLLLGSLSQSPACVKEYQLSVTAPEPCLLPAACSLP